jgi:hypothetical protein
VSERRNPAHERGKSRFVILQTMLHGDASTKKSFRQAKNFLAF